MVKLDTYLGTMVIPDPMNVRAIVEMTNPMDKTGIRCSLDINFLSASHPKMLPPLQHPYKNLTPGVQGKQKPSQKILFVALV